jgi:plasmid maintenance system antidote protein VapI
MEEITGAVGGFRAALQDLLVPELKALQVEVRNVKETLERHEQKISQLVEGLHQLSKDQAERFAAMQQEMDKRFAAMQQENDKKFAEINEKFVVVIEVIRDMQKDMAIIKDRLNYGERIHRLELDMAQLRSRSPVAV